MPSLENWDSGFVACIHDLDVSSPRLWTLCMECNINFTSPPLIVPPNDDQSAISVGQTLQLIDNVVRATSTSNVGLYAASAFISNGLMLDGLIHSIARLRVIKIHEDHS